MEISPTTSAGISPWPDHQPPRRSLGFWIISPWRHIMVITWAFPAFILGFYTHPLWALAGWIIAIATDIAAARYAPEVRLNHERITALRLTDKKRVCLMTWHDIKIRAIVLLSIIALILYLFHRGYEHTLERNTMKAWVVSLVAIAIAFISIMGVRVRNLEQLSPKEKPFFASADFRYAYTKDMLLKILGWPGFFCFFSFFAVGVYIEFCLDWSGTESSFMVCTFFTFVFYLLFVALTPAAYVMSKIKPYLS